MIEHATLRAMVCNDGFLQGFHPLPCNCYYYYRVTTTAISMTCHHLIMVEAAGDMCQHSTADIALRLCGTGAPCAQNKSYAFIC
jgi:hypothetical protein